MKLVKTASGKQKIKISKSEWQAIGKKAGWIKTAANSELSPEEQSKVKSYSWTQDDYKKAFESLRSLGGLPQNDVVEMAARLLGAIPNRIPKGMDGGPHANWLKTEAEILLGKEPDFAGMLSSLLGR